MNVKVDSETGNEDINIGIMSSTPRNQTNTQTGHDVGEVPAYYARCQERMIGGVIGTKTYHTIDEFDDLHPLSNIKRVSVQPLFDTYAFDGNDFFNLYATNG